MERFIGRAAHGEGIAEEFPETGAGRVNPGRIYRSDQGMASAGAAAAPPCGQGPDKGMQQWRRLHFATGSPEALENITRVQWGK